MKPNKSIFIPPYRDMRADHPQDCMSLWRKQDRRKALRDSETAPLNRKQILIAVIYALACGLIGFVVAMTKIGGAA